MGLGVREAQRRDRMRGGSPPRGEGAPDGKRPAWKSPEEPGSRGPSRGGINGQGCRDQIRGDPRPGRQELPVQQVEVTPSWHRPAKEPGLDQRGLQPVSGTGGEH